MIKANESITLLYMLEVFSYFKHASFKRIIIRHKYNRDKLLDGSNAKVVDNDDVIMIGHLIFKYFEPRFSRGHSFLEKLVPFEGI